MKIETLHKTVNPNGEYSCRDIEQGKRMFRRNH